MHNFHPVAHGEHPSEPGPSGSHAPSVAQSAPAGPSRPNRLKNLAKTILHFKTKGKGKERRFVGLRDEEVAELVTRAMYGNL